MQNKNFVETTESYTLPSLSVTWLSYFAENRPVSAKHERLSWQRQLAAVTIATAGQVRASFRPWKIVSQRDVENRCRASLSLCVTHQVSARSDENRSSFVILCKWKTFHWSLWWLKWESSLWQLTNVSTAQELLGWNIFAFSLFILFFVVLSSLQPNSPNVAMLPGRLELPTQK